MLRGHAQFGFEFRNKMLYITKSGTVNTLQE